MREGFTVYISDVLVVVTGAGIGGGLRYTLGSWIAERWGARFPWHTLAINVSGALLLGFLMALSIERGAVGANWRLFIGVGILGGYTTFSTLAYESTALLERGLTTHALVYIFGTSILGLAAVLLGLAIGRSL